MRARGICLPQVNSEQDLLHLFGFWLQVCQYTPFKSTIIIFLPVQLFLHVFIYFCQVFVFMQQSRRGHIISTSVPDMPFFLMETRFREVIDWDYENLLLHANIK